VEERIAEVNCNSCSLSKTRHQIVKGRGDIPARVLFVGQGPGISEDMLGQAFIGPAGALLQRMVDASGITGPFYFTNIVLCRPCDAKGEHDREPKPEEILACRENVLAIARETGAERVVLVGDLAYRYFSKAFPDCLKITHPSALLRAGGERAPGYRENILKLGRLRGLGARRIEDRVGGL
jgi:uracil-DNA glycosylase family 4